MLQSIEACDFERGECGFTIIGWARGITSTYGPRYDHTFGELNRKFKFFPDETRQY